ncbi:hypothetical protein Scep_002878 [Stephania cephalantha]|uniref:Uncharacterized protein n=1 Tax=Stephania cephalantha TaxID=152367 RepID=A0AAP0LCD5_9MAGN
MIWSLNTWLVIAIGLFGLLLRPTHLSGKKMEHSFKYPTTQCRMLLIQVFP